MVDRGKGKGMDTVGNPLDNTVAGNTQGSTAGKEIDTVVADKGNTVADKGNTVVAEDKPFSFLDKYAIPLIVKFQIVWRVCTRSSVTVSASL